MILVAGSANLDFVTPVERLPAPGETVLGAAYFTVPGGKGANQAVACARAGGRVAFVGALGQDDFAGQLRASLRQSGVEDRTVTVGAPTGAAFIGVTSSGENAITVAAGANAHLRPEHLPGWDGIDTLVMQLEIPLDSVVTIAAQARAAGVQVLLNAAPARALPPELLRNTDLLIVNEGELAALSGAAGHAAQLADVQSRGPHTVVVTLGGQGSLTLSGQELLSTPAYPVHVKDTTGAGDTFVGVLAAALSSAVPLPEALRQASVGAALACTRAGAQPSMPTRAELLAAYAAWPAAGSRRAGPK